MKVISLMRIVCASLAFVALMGFGGAACADIEDDLVAYFPLDGDTNDATGNGHNATVSGIPTFTEDRFGHAIAAFDFAPYFGTVAGTDYSSLPLGNASRSISAWIRTAGVPRDMGVFHYGTQGNRGDFHLYITGGNTVGVGNGWGYGTISGATLINDNEWHHIVGIYDNTTSELTIYVDNVLDAQGPISSLPNTGTGSPWEIGRFANQFGLTFSGIIDELRIYSRVLTPTDIEALYNEGIPTELRIIPDTGGDTGAVSVTINGAGFVNGAAVRLTIDGEADIVGEAVTVSENGRVITTTFDLTEKARGLWDVVISNPDGATLTLEDGFTIEEGRDSELWADIVGRSVFRPARRQTFHIFFGNNGNVDVVGGMLWLSGIPLNADIDVRAENTWVPLPDPTIDPGESPPTIHLTDSEQIVAVDVGSLPPDHVGSLSVALTFHESQAQTLDAWSDTVDDVPLIPSPDGCTKLSCVVGDDREAITRALDIAASKYCGPFTRCHGENLCRDAADTLAEALGKEAEEPSSPLYGWGIERVLGCWRQVRKNDWYWSHSSTKLTSPLTGRIYLVDNTKVPGQLCQMIQNGEDKWITPKCDFGRACDWVPDDYSPFECRVPERHDSHSLNPFNSWDPNDKIGSRGASEDHYSSGQKPLRYAIVFENLETARAPAQEVVTTDLLDTVNVDLSTLRFGSISFGDEHITPPPGWSSYSTDIDLRPDNDLIVRVEANLEADTGLLAWRFTSLDPETGEFPENPLAGFLHPNITPPEGEGSVLFTVMPQEGLPTGTVICNQAEIVFDANEPIVTQEWCNTLDNDLPESEVLTLAATQTSPDFEVHWSGTDEGSGIGDYTIYVSGDGEPYTPWLTNTPATTGIFSGENGKTYEFYSVAQDLAGNREAAPDDFDATTLVDANEPPVALCGDATVVANAQCVGDASVDNGSHDPDGGDITVTETPLGPYPLGDTTVTLTITDEAGASASCSAVVTVEDTTPPAISSVSATPDTLWPPNGKIVPVEVSVSATDSCDAALACSISSIESNEPDDGADDSIITGDLTANLRAERLGGGTGRIYTIAVECTDAAGNFATGTTAVTVPHDQGKKM